MPAVITATTSGLSEATGQNSQASRDSLSLRPLRVFVESWIWLLPAILIAIAAWNLRWMSDDGWINIRVVDQVLAGNGPVFNTGQRVEVGTSTLWLWLLIGISALLPWFEPSQLAMVLGTGFTAAAFVLASLGSMHLLASRAEASTTTAGTRTVWVPAGTIVLAALPPMWEFATSGLEMSLALCWLATCFWGLARRLNRSASPQEAAFRPAWLAVLIGLGPLVRPDFALFALAFAVALLVQSRRSIGSWLGAALLAALTPGAYQIFRMGYYAALVPNTALAKDASGARWAEGLDYLFDFVVPYAVWVPLVAVLIVQVICVRGWIANGEVGRAALTIALPAAGLLHGLYFVRVGGDFMHARFLLPATAAILLPIAVYPLRRPLGRLPIILVTVLVLWAITVAAGPRTRYEDIKMEGRFSGRPVAVGLANERGWWKSVTNSHETVRAREWIWSRSDAEEAVLARWDAERGRSYYQERPSGSDVKGGAIQDHTPTRTGIVAPAQPGVFVAVQNIGATGVLAGAEVHIVDAIGLADPVSARVRYDPAVNTPARIGHEVKPIHWRLAQYAAPADGESADLQRAREVLQCRPVRDLVQATNAELTPSLFLSNIRHSVEYTRLTIPADSLSARWKLCR